MNTCEQMQEQISAMLDGELNEQAQAEVQAHIAECGECRAMYEAFLAVRGAFSEQDTPETLHSGIMSRVYAAEKACKTQKKLVRLRYLSTIAACLIVVIGTTIALKGAFSPKASDKAETMMVRSAAKGSFAMTDEAAAEECETAEITVAGGEMGSAERTEGAFAASAEEEYALDHSNADAPDSFAENKAISLEMKVICRELTEDGFTAEVLDCGSGSFAEGTLVRVILNENTHPFAGNLLSGETYSLVYDLVDENTVTALELN